MTGSHPAQAHFLSGHLCLGVSLTTSPPHPPTQPFPLPGVSTLLAPTSLKSHP